MDNYLKVLAELKKRGVLFLKEGVPTLNRFKDGRKFSFLQFKNSDITHEESQNYFSVYYTRIEELKKEVLYFKEGKEEDLLRLVQNSPFILSYGTLLSIDIENSKKEFLSISRNESRNEIDKISNFHNLVNYLIFIEITV